MLAVLIFGLYGISKLRVENSFISYFKDMIEIYKGMQVQKGVFLCGEVKASLLSNFEPMTGVAIGILLLGETLTLRSAAGIAGILIAAALTSRIRR